MSGLRSLTLVAAVAAPALGAGSATASETASPGLQALLDERAVIRIADRIDRAVDAKDWPLARSYFADRVTVDFSSLNGQPPATIPADELIAGWAGNLKGNKTSLHLRTNHDVVIEGDHATVHSNGYAWNRMEGNGEPLWEVWGTYRHRLTRMDGSWKVDGFVFRATHERGNSWVKTTPGQ
jgi:hypothetical protein